MNKRKLLLIVLLAVLFVFLGVVSAESVPYTSVKLTKKSMTLAPGGTYQLALKSFKPAEANDGKWVSENEAVVTVDETGLVTASPDIPKTAKAYVYFVSGDQKLAKCRFTVKVKQVTGVVISKKKLSLHPGRTYSLEASVRPSKPTYPTLYWDSSAPSVVAVSQQGTLKALSYGKATITVQASNGKKATCAVTVEDVPVTKVKLNHTKLTVGLNGSLPITAKVYPDGAKDLTVTWSSADPGIASVSQDGVVSGKKTGKVVITATANDGSGTKAECVVTVIERKLKSIALKDESAKLLDVGEKYKIEVSFNPVDATNRDVQWSSSDESVVTVDANGTVTAHKSGMVTVTGKADNGKKSVTKRVYVRSSSAKEVTISFGGDVVLGGDPRVSTATHTVITHGTLVRFKEQLKLHNGDVSFVLDNLKDIFEADDLTVVNLESAMTTRGAKYAYTKYAFKGEPEYTKALAANGVDAVTIRNNMTTTCGKNGYADTKKSIETYCAGKVRWFDHQNAVVLQRNGVKIGLLGLATLAGGGETPALTRKYVSALRSQCDVLVVYIHWAKTKVGTKYPNSGMKKIAHVAVEAGADIVVGSGPHCLEGIELYQNKYIVYSLGNLATGGNGDKDTYIYQQTFKAYDGFCENGDRNFIYVHTSDNKKEFNVWHPILVTAEADKQAIYERLKEYSSVFDTPGI